MYKYIYTLSKYLVSRKKIEEHFCLPSTPPIKLALRARRVDPELDPGGSGKEMVGKGFGTVRARLTWVQFYKRNPFKRNF